MDETRDQIMGEITALKSMLRENDYEVTKYAEGLTDCTTQAEIEAYREAFMEQYGDVIENRKAWRAKIRELEETLDALVDEAEPEAEAEDEAEPESWPSFFAEDQPEDDPVTGDADVEPEETGEDDAPDAPDGEEDSEE